MVRSLHASRARSDAGDMYTVHVFSRSGTGEAQVPVALFLGAAGTSVSGISATREHILTLELQNNLRLLARTRRPVFRLRAAGSHSSC